MALLTRDQILSANDLPEMKKVSVPEWGGEVFVKVMTGRERDAFEKAHLDTKGSDVRARMVAATVCDETGKPLFSLNDVNALAAKSWIALNRVVEASSEINQVSEAAIADLEKNSSESPSDAS